MISTEPKADASDSTKLEKDPTATKRRRTRRKVARNPIPSSMRQNPKLNHPGLTLGQKKFLGSVCTVYSTENMKKSIEEQYVRQLLYEKDKGMIKGADWLKYLDYFCQSSKRKHLFQPPIAHSRKTKSSKARSKYDINKPLFTPLPPIPRAVTQNINNESSEGRTRYVTTIRRNESIPDVAFTDEPVDANITIIDDDDKISEEATNTTDSSTSNDNTDVSLSNNPVDANITVIEDSSEEEKPTEEVHATDTTISTSYDNGTEVSDAISNSQTEEDVTKSQDENEHQTESATENPEPQKLSTEEQADTTENTQSEEKIDEEGGEKTKAVSPVASEKESATSETEGNEFDEVASEKEEKAAEDSAKDESDSTANEVECDKERESLAEISKQSEKETEEEVEQNEEKVCESKEGTSTSCMDEDAEAVLEEAPPLGEPTTNLLTLLEQPDNEEATSSHVEGVTRPKSRIGGRPV